MVRIQHQMRMDSCRLLGRLNQKYGPESVRIWFDAFGSLVGVWQAKNGNTYAVGHDRQGKTIIYNSTAPYDNWKRG